MAHAGDSDVGPDELATRMANLEAGVATSGSRLAEQERLLAEISSKLDALASAVDASTRLLRRHDAEADRHMNEIMGYAIAGNTRLGGAAKRAVRRPSESPSGKRSRSGNARWDRTSTYRRSAPPGTLHGGAKQPRSPSPNSA